MVDRYRPNTATVAAMGDPITREPALRGAAQRLDRLYAGLGVPLRDRQAISDELIGHAIGTSSVRSPEQLAATVEVADLSGRFAIAPYPQRRGTVVFTRHTPSGSPIHWKI